MYKILTTIIFGSSECHLCKCCVHVLPAMLGLGSPFASSCIKFVEFRTNLNPSCLLTRRPSDRQVADQYGTDIPLRLYMCMLLLPLILVNFIRNLKYLAPFSTFALVSSIVAFGVVLHYIFDDLPPISTREPVGEPKNWALFFGTVLFALEAIGVVRIPGTSSPSATWLPAPSALSVGGRPWPGRARRCW